MFCFTAFYHNSWESLSFITTVLQKFPYLQIRMQSPAITINCKKKHVTCVSQTKLNPHPLSNDKSRSAEQMDDMINTLWTKVHVGKHNSCNKYNTITLIITARSLMGIQIFCEWWSPLYFPHCLHNNIADFEKWMSGYIYCRYCYLKRLVTRPLHICYYSWGSNSETLKRKIFKYIARNRYCHVKF
mgnify:CR=1 FL=1